MEEPLTAVRSFRLDRACFHDGARLVSFGFKIGFSAHCAQTPSRHVPDLPQGGDSRAVQDQLGPQLLR